MTEAVPLAGCRGCGDPRLALVLDLGDQPACDHFPWAAEDGPDPRWPLGLVLCERCALLQLSHSSPAPEEPLAVESRTLRQHALDMADRLVGRLDLPRGTRFREFASHHGGSWADALVNAGMVDVADEADLVIDNQSIIHAEDLEAELAARVEALGPDGRLVVEFHHALAQLTQGQFDTVRHGHPLYFSLHSWSAACARHGLDVVDAWTEDVFGGCLIVVAQRGGRPPSEGVHDIVAAERQARLTQPTAYEALARAVTDLRSRLLHHLTAAREQGRRVAAYGAGSKACTLLGVTGIDESLVEVVADLAPGKHGRRIPGCGIPIVSPDALIRAAPDDILILTWDIVDEVVAQLRAAGLPQTTFVVPLPRWRSIS